MGALGVVFVLFVLQAVVVQSWTLKSPLLSNWHPSIYLPPPITLLYFYLPFPFPLLLPPSLDPGSPSPSLAALSSLYHPPVNTSSLNKPPFLQTLLHQSPPLSTPHIRKYKKVGSDAQSTRLSVFSF